MPFDNIYWNGGISFKDTGEFEESGPKESRIGITANGNPHSTFSFVGNRRTQIRAISTIANPQNVNAHSYLTFTTQGIAEPYAGGLVNNMTAADIPAGSPAGTTLFDIQNRESAHHLSHPIHIQNATNFFMGIHFDDMLSITTTGKPYKGCYLILKRKTFFYNEWNMTTNSTTFVNQINFGGVNVNVTDAVIRPDIVPKEDYFTGHATFKGISIFQNGTLLRPSGFVEVPSTTILDYSTGGNPAITCTVVGNTVSFNNMFQNNNEARRYFTTDFQIKIGGTDFAITSVNAGGTLTLAQAPGNQTNIPFSIMIPAGAPDVANAGHVGDSGRNTAVANTAGWEGFTWGGIPSKWLGINALFENQDNYGSNTPNVGGPATRSPYWSNKDAEEFIIEPLKNNGTQLFFPRDNFSWIQDPANNFTDTSATVHNLPRPSEISRAGWPNYNNNLNTADFPATVNNTRVAQVQAWETAAGRDAAYWDGPLWASRTHGVGNFGSTAPADPSSTVANIQAAQRNSHCYPYCLAAYGWDSANFNRAGGPIVAQNLGNEHCFVILDTNQVIPPNTTFQVAIQNGIDINAHSPAINPIRIGQAMAGGAVGFDDFNYTRLNAILPEYELIIVAK